VLFTVCKLLHLVFPPLPEDNSWARRLEYALMALRKLILSLTILLLAAPLALAQGTYTQLDFPGAAMTEATGINTAGDITGLYADSTGGHGFLLRAAAYTSIDYPGIQYSYAYGINDKDQIVGLAEPVGYLYNIQSQTFTTISYPGATATYPLAINNAGTIAGYFQHGSGHRTGTEGFELVGSAFHKIGPAGATSTYPWGISTSAKIVGYSYIAGSGAYVDFSFDNAKFQQITIPNAAFPLVYGTNPEGTAVVGSYEPVTGVAGFIYRNRTLQPLSFPGSITTEAYGINAAGEVVGYFIDQSYNTHGFLWTPPAGDGEHK
jgi:probable HAF family extracellular repeat protein